MRGGGAENGKTLPHEMSIDVITRAWREMARLWPGKQSKCDKIDDPDYRQDDRA